MRTHYCHQVDETLLEQTVEICGWVNNRRDHGGVIFLDIRDKTGLVQVVYEPENEKAFQDAETLRHEFVIHVTGMVRPRPEGMVNPNLASGKIEVLGSQLEILNQAKTPPFLPDENQKVNEDLRLTYRYLDLRRPRLQNNLRVRAEIISFMRRFLEAEGFLDIETPMLTKATPEGARDYLVPSRTHPGKFFALPQSPQLFKQLLMMSGFDRYYQIVRCFRDEDLRADRQPEFTQLDIETSFMDEASIQKTMEEMICKLFEKVQGVKLARPFPSLSYEEAMREFGSDKPDLRIPLRLVDLDDLLKEVEFKVFKEPAQSRDGRVVALRLPKGCELTRKELDDYTKFVAIYGARGLAYIKVNNLEAGIAGLQSPILKFLPEEVVFQILERAQAVTGDVVFFGAGKTQVVNESMGALRVKLGHDRGMVKLDAWAPLWVVDWPMFEESEEGRLQALHHPFTAPKELSQDALKKAPLEQCARAYDLVLNGSEIGGGSVRIHQKELQQTVFELLGIEQDQAKDKFGFLLEALDYGCPPHAGIAFGLDRIAMLMTGSQSIREVIAFPKTQSASCLMTQAPASVSEAQLDELAINLTVSEEEE